MKNTRNSLFFLLFLCSSWAMNAQYIQVDDTYSAQQLVQNVLVSNSPCAGVSNFSVSGDTFSGSQNSYGFFSKNTSIFPFTNGIVLATSSAKKAEGPNSSLVSEGSLSWAGDADLEQALGISGSYNATSLEFDFIPITNKISFDYILYPTAFTKTSTTPDQIVYAQLTGDYSCTAIAEITLKTIPSTLILASTPQPLVNEFSGGGNSVSLVPPDTIGTYEFSLDGTNYQASPLFINLLAGDYTGYIRNSSTCEYNSNPFVILDYPHFFTPNEDGINDEWEIKNLDTSYPKAIISIFDRYGKLLKQITAGGGNWKGTFNGLKLPTDDYWFTIDLKNGEIVKGHFSLKR